MYVKPIQLPDSKDIIQVSDIYYIHHTAGGWLRVFVTPDTDLNRIFDLRPLFAFVDAGGVIATDGEYRMWYFEQSKLPIQLANRIQLNRNDHTRGDPGING